jgi:peptide/nickel transport system substrate-binding protein
MRVRHTAFLGVAMLAVALGPSACTGSGDSVDYAVDGPLATYNSATTIGAASGAPQAFARVQIGFNYHGPDSQMVADRDFGTVAVVGRAPLTLDYSIADNAVYSDGKPVTCDDMVLAWAAQSGQYSAFDSAGHAGYADIAAVDCAPGQKRARVTFTRDRSFTDFGQLFAATSMMPSHVIADELKLGDGGVTKAIQAGDVPTLIRIAQAWNTLWDLKPGVDLRRFPSAGPYKLSSVGSDGSVVLVANDKWWGAKPKIGKVTVWPYSAGVADRIKAGKVQVADIAAGTIDQLKAPKGFHSTDYPSAGIEQLIFGGQGPLADPDARRALALCTPRDVIAAGLKLPIANVRLSPVADDSLAVIESAGANGQFGAADIDGARTALDGQPLTVRLGYRGPDARLAAVVGQITKSCAAAGITVQDSGGPAVGPQSLRDNDIDVLLASTGGAAGSGSSGSSTVDAYSLHSGDGNNLSGYANERVDGVIGALAVTTDPKEQSRLLGEAAPLLWTDLPTLPLYRQQRTLLTSGDLSAVSSNPTRWGAGWNMDRWTVN